MSRLKALFARLWQLRQRVNSKNFLQFLTFVAIAGAFWCFVTFNNTMQQDVTVTVKLVGKPSGITFIDDIPPTITVTVKDKGTTFLKLLFRRQPTITLDYNSFVDEKNSKFIVGTTALQALSKTLFRREASIVRVTPEYIECRVTDRLPKRVPVNYLDHLDIKPDKRFVLYGDISCEPDSVLVYGDASVLASITEVNIHTIRESNIEHSISRVVRLQAVDGARFEPSRVTVSIPVQPLIHKRQALPVQVRNAPEGVNVIVFPGTVDATFLVPQSLYKKTDESFVAVVDYNTIEIGKNKVAVSIGEVPAVYENIKLLTDSVEYIIEK